MKLDDIKDMNNEAPPGILDTNSVSLSYLQERAADQRRSMHNSVSKLRSAASRELKQRLDVNRNLRSHFWPIAGVAALAALALGYNVTGIFTDR